MANGWFETAAAAQRRAKKVLPKSVYWSIVAGSERGATLRDNVAAFGELGSLRTLGKRRPSRTWRSRCWASRCRCR